MLHRNALLETKEQLLATAASAGLSLVAETATLDTMGLDFVVLHARDEAGTRWIVRTPRRPDVIAAARREARVLGCARAALPVAVPDWRVHTDALIAYPRLEGTPVVTLDTGAPVWNIIDPAAPSEAFLTSLGEALAAMQAVDATGAVPVDAIDELRRNLAATIEATRDALEPPASLVARWQRWLADDASWPAHVALAHGDLHPGHLLLHDDGRIAGILDWTEARVTDPAVDFAMVHMCFGRAALDAVLRVFADRGGRTWPRMAEHAVERSAIFPALGAEWSLRTGNPMALDFAKAQLAALA